MSPPSDSHALVQAAIDGDGVASQALVDIWLDPVLGWCARMGGPRVDPEDAAQDVFVVMLTRIETLRQADRFSQWLYGITRRVLAKHRRRVWLRRWTPGSILRTPSELPDPLELAELSQLSREVQRALETLSAEHREILVLRVVEQRTGEEVAELLDLPLGTVKSRLGRARTAFRRAAVDIQPVWLDEPVTP